MPEAPTVAGTVRDRYVDALRALSLLVVVVWHWVFNLVIKHEHSVHATNPIGHTRGLWLLTWVLQVMPVFFMVGGHVHGMILSKDVRWGPFVRRRLSRLVPPAAVLLVLFLVGQATMAIAEAPGWMSDGMWLMISPLWFLVVYVLLVLVAPILYRAHLVAGPVVPALLIGGSMTIDLLRFNILRESPGAWVWLSMLLVWGFVHQLGFHFADLRRADPRAQEAVVLIGFFMLVGLTNMNLYPRSLVGVPGERLSNMTPPTLAICALGVLQFGLAARLAGAGERLLLQERWWRRVQWASRYAMPIFIWHTPGYLLAFVLLDHLGVEFRSFTVEWWLWRPVYLALPALFTAPLIWLASRVLPLRV
ncbi:MAG: acyltransferase [Acidimicrobiales bacterium]|nr:MAG: acyltransferase [Acidimicrobiales bacterium]